MNERKSQNQLISAVLAETLETYCGTLVFQGTPVEKRCFEGTPKLGFLRFQIQENKFSQISHLFRVLIISSECKLAAKLRQIQQLFLANGYSEIVILNNIGLKIAKFNGVKLFTSSKCSLYMRLPWIGPGSQVYIDKISSLVQRCF